MGIPVAERAMRNGRKTYHITVVFDGVSGVCCDATRLVLSVIMVDRIGLTLFARVRFSANDLLIAGNPTRTTSPKAPLPSSSEKTNQLFAGDNASCAKNMSAGAFVDRTILTLLS